MLDRLRKLINQHILSCSNKQINIITDDNNNELIRSITKEYRTSKISNLIDDFSQACLIIIKYENPNGIILNFINNYVTKKIIMIVEKDFDFNNLVINSKANSIDAIILKNEFHYLIILNKF